MAVQRTNIKQHINKSIPKSNGNKPPAFQGGKPSFLDSPIFMMAKQMIPNIPAKFKYIIVSAIYFIVAGVIATIVWIIQLTLFIINHH